MEMTCRKLSFRSDLASLSATLLFNFHVRVHYAGVRDLMEHPPAIMYNLMAQIEEFHYMSDDGSVIRSIGRRTLGKVLDGIARIRIGNQVRGDVFCVFIDKMIELISPKFVQNAIEVGQEKRRRDKSPLLRNNNKNIGSSSSAVELALLAL
ncbi:hypothetical protein H5410_025770 [Solanum commersonii]|uniref:Uncharacterized protein n=1 Tax=Solanum commersonii TaxID=4109 RepID=A0A9J5YZH5_SOLCO|nr:hypothetical protein H5410_025770 [Solanum commersonii]